MRSCSFSRNWAFFWSASMYRACRARTSAACRSEPCDKSAPSRCRLTHSSIHPSSPAIRSMRCMRAVLTSTAPHSPATNADRQLPQRAAQASRPVAAPKATDPAARATRQPESPNGCKRSKMAALIVPPAEEQPPHHSIGLWIGTGGAARHAGRATPMLPLSKRRSTADEWRRPTQGCTPSSARRPQ